MPGTTEEVETPPETTQVPEVQERVDGDAVISEGLLVEAVGTVEAGPVGRGAAFAEDGTVKVAIIRPCVSRGKRLRGLPPIYSPRMLAENASVFADWHMFIDHLPAAVGRLMQRKQRGIGELGGRVVESWYDPEFESDRDAENGYQRGAVMGRVIPYPATKALLEVDARAVEVSINCWPTAASPGAAPWNPETRGMMIEGFRRTPRGSVDWVLRGGAGGALAEEEEGAFAVSVLESLYAPQQEMALDLTNITDVAALAEAIREEKPELAEALTAPAPTPAPTPAPRTTEPPKEKETTPSLTEADVEAAVERALEEAGVGSAPDGEELEEQVQGRVTEMLRARDEAHELERLAEGIIDDASLPESWRDKLKESFRVTADGVPDSLIVSESDLTDDTAPEDVVESRVTREVEEAIELHKAAAPAPRVTGHGAAGEPIAEGEQSEFAAAYENFLRESGDLTDEEGKSRDAREALREMEEAA